MSGHEAAMRTRRMTLVVAEAEQVASGLGVLAGVEGDVWVTPRAGLAEAVRSAEHPVTVVVLDRLDAGVLAEVRPFTDIELAVSTAASVDGLGEDDLGWLALEGVRRLGDQWVLLLSAGTGAPVTPELWQVAPLLTETAHQADGPAPADDRRDQSLVRESDLRAQLADAQQRIEELDGRLATARERNERLVARRRAHEETLQELERHQLGRWALARVASKGERRRWSRRNLIALGAVGLVAALGFVLWQGALGLAFIAIVNSLLLLWLLWEAREAAWERGENRRVSDLASRRAERLLKRVDSIMVSLRASEEEAVRGRERTQSHVLALEAAIHDAQRKLEQSARP